MHGITLLILTGASFYLVRKLLSFIKALQAIQYVKLPMINTVLLSTTLARYHPGKRALLSPASILGAILPQIPLISYGRNLLFTEKHQRECL